MFLMTAVPMIMGQSVPIVKDHAVRKPNPANLYSDLPTLAAASDTIVLAQISRNSCGMGPSGHDPVTTYEAQAIAVYKGSLQGRFWFSVPTGATPVAPRVVSAVSYAGFTPPHNGGRYILFLRFSRGEEAQITRGLRLTGDAVQGAFELNDELLEPTLRGDALRKRYWHTPVSGFLSQIEALIKSQRGY